MILKFTLAAGVCALALALFFSLNPAPSENHAAPIKRQAVLKPSSDSQHENLGATPPLLTLTAKAPQNPSPSPNQAQLPDCKEGWMALAAFTHEMRDASNDKYGVDALGLDDLASIQIMKRAASIAACTEPTPQNLRQASEIETSARAIWLIGSTRRPEPIAFDTRKLDPHCADSFCDSISTARQLYGQELEEALALRAPQPSLARALTSPLAARSDPAAIGWMHFFRAH